MPSMTTPWKHPKTGVYYFRRAIPAELREIIGRGRELKRSLGTKCPREAKRLILPYLSESEELFNQARERLSNPEKARLTAKEAAFIASRWYTRLATQIDQNGGDKRLAVKHIGPNGEVLFDTLSDALLLQGTDIHRATESELKQLAEQIGWLIDEQLEIEGILVDKESSEYVLLAKEFYPMLYHLEALCRARELSNWRFEPLSPLHHPTGLNSSLPTRKTTLDNARSRPTGKRISEVFAEYRESEELLSRGDLSRPQTLDSYRGAINRLIEIIGDLPIASVGRQHIIKFRDTCLRLPKDKSSKVRSMGIDKQIAYAEASGVPTVSETTVRNRLKQISVVFRYAVEAEYIDSNPVERVKKPSKPKVKDANESRRGYTVTEINKIFSHPIFNDRDAHKRHGWASYWVPIICRYTGARLNEIGQLHKSDVAIVDDVWSIHIRRGENQTIKSDSSVRLVALHQHMIDLGLPEYVEALKDGPLFPDIPRNRYGKTTQALSKWWADVVRKQGVTPKAPAHEFRHTLKTELRSLLVPDSLSHRITGHSLGSEGDNYGGAELVAQKKALDQIPRLNIERLAP